MTLGDRYTDNMDQIYRITIKLIIETVIAGYEMEEERELKANSFVYRRGYVNATITTIKSSAHNAHIGAGSSKVAAITAPEEEQVSKEDDAENNNPGSKVPSSKDSSQNETKSWILIGNKI